MFLPSKFRQALPKFPPPRAAPPRIFPPGKSLGERCGRRRQVFYRARSEGFGGSAAMITSGGSASQFTGTSSALFCVPVSSDWASEDSLGNIRSRSSTAGGNSSPESDSLETASIGASPRSAGEAAPSSSSTRTEERNQNLNGESPWGIIKSSLADCLPKNACTKGQYLCS